MSVLAHELRTPLNAILGWSRLLRTRNLEGLEATHALQVIGRNAHVQAQLISDLFDASRIFTGKLGLNISLVDLARVIEAAADSVRLEASAKSIRLELDLAPSASIEGDANRLQRDHEPRDGPP